MSIVVAGHLCVDVIPVLGETSPGLSPGMLYSVGPLVQRVGGSVANTGGTLHRLGDEVHAYATIGDDELGAVCRAQLDDRLGPHAHLTTSTLGTSYSIVVEHPRHDRTFWQYEGANADFDPRSLVLPDDAELLHVGYPSLLPGLCLDDDALADAFRAAHARGVATSLDLAHVADGSVAARVDWDDWFARTVPHVDVWSPSWDDISSALRVDEPPTPEALAAVAERMLAWGAAIVCLSAGTLGFHLRVADTERLRAAGRPVATLADSWAGAELWFPAERIEAPSTTVGAGDALTGGLLHAIVAGLPPEDAGAFARSVVGQHLTGGAE
ncbi:MAG: carbohydrate kinase family protein [Arachnia sp.]